MQRTRIRDFTRGNITRQLLLFAWPLFLSNLLQVVYNMVDMIIVGNYLGKAGISAVSVGGDVSHFLTFVAMGFSAAGQVLIARSLARASGRSSAALLARWAALCCLAPLCSVRWALPFAM